VISVRDSKDWASLCGIIGKGEWATYDLDQIKTRRQEVDVAVGSWTKELTKQEAARILQSMNIPAGPVNTTPETIFYPPIRYRELYRWVTHPYGGIAPVPSMPAKFSKTPFPIDYEPTHAVGGDNDYVYRKLLGLSDLAIKELEEKQIIRA
jgi:formyl-CoA transferase